MQNLPDKLYTVDSIVQLEQIAINQYDILAYELMKRAGEAVFNVVLTNYSQQKKIVVICGAGNNAGDGYVIARLAKQAGFDVRVFSLIDPAVLTNEASLAYHDWLDVSEDKDSYTSVILSFLEEAEVIVDALLGTGLSREISAEWAECINMINNVQTPVISIDIPSGLVADTGAISGVAVKADVTVSFIGLKQGLFTAQASEVCGQIVFDDLALPDEVYSQIECNARLISHVNPALLPERKASSHKGCFGHVLIAGGGIGMAGAVILAAKAALRAGAGLVTIVTVPQNLSAISYAVPEAMVKTCGENSIDDLFDEDFVNGLTHVAIGMGLGQGEWALKLLQCCVELNLPMLIDADALNIVAKLGVNNFAFSPTQTIVITPHPGEAARLLSAGRLLSPSDIQLNRFRAVRSLHALFKELHSCSVILKGSGTLIFDGQTLKICRLGSAAMAAPGMGDVLSGVLIALSAQNQNNPEISINEISEVAVCVHATAADSVSDGKTRGLLASDVINALPGAMQ